MKHHFIYKITNQVNGHFYIGVHSTDNIEDGYMGSGTLMKFALKKYGIEAFQREIIEVFETKKEAFQRESELVTVNILRDKSCYNLVLGGGGVPCKPLYSSKAEQIHVLPKVVIPFDTNYEYKIDLLKPVKVSNPEILTSFGKVFWDIITGADILTWITDMYNDAFQNGLAKKYILLLERIPAFRNNILIYRYEKTTLVNNSYASR